MSVNARAFVVVAVIAWLFFFVAKRVAGDLISDEDYVRRRNVWFILTAGGFLLPNFWLYVALAVFVLAWAAGRDSNPAALYMLVLYALPPTEFQIPQFIAVNQLRILSVVILIPIAYRAMNRADVGAGNRLTWLDTFVIAFGLWQLVLFIPYEAFTNTIRRFSVYFLDTFIIFFAIARAGQSRKELAEIVIVFVLAACLMSVLAGFEYSRSWLLYQYISEAWGQENFGAYLLRDGKLRSQVSAGHALILGYVMVFAFGLSLYVRHQLVNVHARRFLPLVMWVGLFAAYSRGPWLAAVFTFFCYFSVQPQGLRKAAKALFVMGAVFGVVLMTPLGSNIISTLPFVGTVEQENVTYRQQLAALSWRLILENPWIGDPFFLDNMEELRQGQGIIDLMNGYAAVALASGVIGLTFYIGLFVVGAWKTLMAARRLSHQNDQFSELGFSLVACTLGTLLTIGVAGTGSIYYVLAGMMAAYIRVTRAEIAQAQHEDLNSRTSVRFAPQSRAARVDGVSSWRN